MRPKIKVAEAGGGQICGMQSSATIGQISLVIRQRRYPFGQEFAEAFTIGFHCTGWKLPPVYVD
jgi:hypothetical protein